MYSLRSDYGAGFRLLCAQTDQRLARYDLRFQEDLALSYLQL